MSKPQRMAIVAISTVMLTRKHYIESHATRQNDKKELPVFTPDPNRAHSFANEQQAKDLIPNLVNHMERVFTVETIEVEVAKRPATIGEFLK